jgi:predicted Rossmann fold flavoprotein
LEQVDIAIIGAGAAGLFAGIFAGRTHPQRSIVLLDGAKKPGAKILVSGGGRCNVTHNEIDVNAYAGSSPNAIRKVLRRFDVPQTIQFFRELGVELKREETGKLFPVSDDAHSVLNALLSAAQAANTRLRHPYRVESVQQEGTGFRISGAWGELYADKVVLATGGKSLPKTGSDGHGYQIAKALGHTITPRIFPALVPLTLPRDHFICGLSGLTLPTTLEVRSVSGKKIIAFTNSTLCTHFGLSGPAVLDISRYYTDAVLDNPNATLSINWIPDLTTESLDTLLQASRGVTLLKLLTRYLPERLVRALCAETGLEASLTVDRLTREQRRKLAQTVTQLRLPITGDRGFTYAEVTAGGIPLSEIRLETMESRLCPNLYLCGEICDVDGRIGGYNFQWAWASGYVAGISV